MQENNEVSSNSQQSIANDKDTTQSIEEKDTYYTQFNMNIFVSFIIFFVSCSLITIWLFIIYLDGNDLFIYYSIIPIILLFIVTVIFSFYPIFSKIKIDIKNKLVTIAHIKILFCLNKYIYVNLIDIELVSIEKNSKIDIYDAFNLIFKMKKDKKILVFDGESDKNNESQNLFEFMRDALPKYIPVSSDLITINQLYPNIKTNRVTSSSNNIYINLNKPQGSTALDFE